MIAGAPKSFSFPSSAELKTRRTSQDGAAKEEAAVKEAIARGYAQGLDEGRRAARADAQSIADAARREGFEAGVREARAQIEQLAAALSEAAAALERERAESVREAESFCVNLALAITGRLLQDDQARAEFAAHLVAEGLKVLAPEPPQAIFLNPADHALVGADFPALPLKDDPTLARGHARVEAGRLVVEGGIDQAFEQIKSAVLDTRARRLRRTPA